MAARIAAGEEDGRSSLLEEKEKVAEAPGRTLSTDLQKLRKYKVNIICQTKTKSQNVNNKNINSQ